MLKPDTIFDSIGYGTGENGDFEPMPCAIPCPHKKGSWQQLECLRQRLERGEELYHPEDCRDVEMDHAIRAAVTKLMHKAKKVESKRRRDEQVQLAKERRRKRREMSGTGNGSRNLSK